jgi:hypothetical protein
MVLVWNKGVLVRTALGLLVMLQWIWGADVYFFRTHSMLGDSPIRATGEFLGAAQRGNHERPRISPTLEKIGLALPKGARTLFHYERLRLGLATQIVDDAPGWQGGIDYLSTDSPQATFDLLQNIGVTHALWVQHRATLSRADFAREAVFARTAAVFFEQGRPIDGWQIGFLREKNAKPSKVSNPTTIAWLTCNSDAAAGIYNPKGLAAGIALRFWPATSQAPDVQTELSAVNTAITRAHCPATSVALGILNSEFTQALQAGEMTLWIRTKE